MIITDIHLLIIICRDAEIRKTSEVEKHKERLRYIESLKSQGRVIEKLLDRDIEVI